MRKKPGKLVLKEIDELFVKAKDNPKISKRYVAMARKLAKRNNISLKRYRRLFCHNCNTFFTGKNCIIRISNGNKSVKCLECGHYLRFKLS
jgi:ribonuclease P protein subunit RPR2